MNYALDLAIDNGIVGIVSWNNEFAEQWEARSRAFSEQIIAFMQKHFSLSLSCMVGEPQPTNDLHQSFSSATSLAEYRIFGEGVSPSQYRIDPIAIVSGTKAKRSPPSIYLKGILPYTRVNSGHDNCGSWISASKSFSSK